MHHISIYVFPTENLHFGAIVTSLGVRYKSYCSNIVRNKQLHTKKLMIRLAWDWYILAIPFPFHGNNRGNFHLTKKRERQSWVSTTQRSHFFGEESNWFLLEYFHLNIVSFKISELKVVFVIRTMLVDPSQNVQVN